MTLPSKQSHLLHDEGVFKRDPQGESTSVVGVNNLGERVGTGVGKRNREFLSVQTNRQQLNIFGDVAEVDCEGAFGDGRSVCGENVAWQQGRGEGPLKSHSGSYVILCQDLLQVQMKYIKLVETAGQKALKQIQAECFQRVETCHCNL